LNDARLRRRLITSAARRDIFLCNTPESVQFFFAERRLQEDDVA
jgi:hypothetical protein